MKSRPWIGLLALLLTAPAIGADGGTKALRDLLDAFLAGASTNDAAMHDRFWANDLVYTSSSGERFGKQAIMDGLAQAPQTDAADLPTYRGEDVDIRMLDDIAVVTFRLVAEGPGDTTGQYFNTGVFQRIDDRWKAVTWQATRIPDGAD